MKPTSLTLLIGVFFLAGCGKTSTSENNATDSLKTEILALDSIVTQSETMTEEITESAKKVDALLDSLEN